MPENTHPLSKQYFEQYIRIPMLNTALIRVWSLLNGGNYVWPACVICLFNYPYDSDWERNAAFCEYK